ncbi:50S ribosomal protein L35 [Rhodotorula toruloides]|uniref:50S ribosomal protein L35 n=1 Tax=Rhodotorula toruloides TaxID=5286 RepID=A0A511KMA2_RHOTO|nr:50S ribosomal protein L35 [Rhodotorula toruloides]
MLAWQPVRALARIAARPPSASTWTAAAFASRSFTRLFSPFPPNNAASPLGVRTFTASAVALLMRKPTRIKLKTHQGAKKRFKALANGMYKRAKAGKAHLNSNGSMSSTRLNTLGKTAYANKAERRKLRKLMPYSC